MEACRLNPSVELNSFFVFWTVLFFKMARALCDNHSFSGFLKQSFPIFEIGCFLQRLNLWNDEIKSVDSGFKKRVKYEAISESSASN